MLHAETWHHRIKKSQRPDDVRAFLLPRAPWNGLRVVAALVALLPATAHAQVNGDLLLLDRSALAEARRAYLEQPSNLPPAVSHVLQQAEEALDAPLVSVMDKSETPPSGDKHDYLSLGPYWWPDSTKPDGLPYIRRDGEVNPEVRRYGDKNRMAAMVDRVQALALTYALTNDERYATKAIDQVDHWFVAPATRMNPNLNFGQAIKGVVTGRGIGIIETYQFRYLIDALTLLRSSAAWTPAVDSGLKAWLNSYLTWLLDSPYGKDEAAWKNNHGTAYDVQVSCIATYLGKPEIVRGVLAQVLTKRIAIQVEPDGSQPLELERTKSWGYSNMNLEAHVELALLGERFGEDLWYASTPDGRSLRRALLFLLPTALGERPWAWSQFDGVDRRRVYYAVSLASSRFDDPLIRRAAADPVILEGAASLRWFFVPVRSAVKPSIGH